MVIKTELSETPLAWTTKGNACAGSTEHPAHLWGKQPTYWRGFSCSEVVPGHPNVDIHGCLLAGSQPLLHASPSSESVLLHGPERGLCIKTGHLGCTVSEKQSASFMPVSWILPEGSRIGHWAYLLREPSSPRIDQGHCTQAFRTAHACG